MSDRKEGECTEFSFISRYSTFTDILTPEEEEEINRERLIKEKAFNLLLNRENELAKIRNGELISKKKPKSTVRTKKVAFTQYMKMFYDKPRPTVSVTISHLSLKIQMA